MSLKLLALFAAGLVAPPSVEPRYELPTGGFDNIPDFSYNKITNNQNLSLEVTDGKLHYDWVSFNQSDWRFLQGDRSAIYAIKNHSPIRAIYDHYASVDNATQHGYTGIILDNVEFNVTLTAKEDENNCTIDTTVTLGDGVTVSLDLFWGVDDAFRAPAVCEEVQSVAWGLLSREVPVKLANSIAYDVNRLDAAKLCKEILVATPQSFPCPEIINPLS